jgi:hypothetical protein
LHTNIQRLRRALTLIAYKHTNIQTLVRALTLIAYKHTNIQILGRAFTNMLLGLGFKVKCPDELCRNIMRKKTL